jgi:hypothetical protein
MFPSRPSPSGWYPEMARDRGYALEVARAMGLIGPRTSGSTCGAGELSGKREIGRPTTTGKPWEAEGISRQAWYKRQKKSKGAE